MVNTVKEYCPYHVGDEVPVKIEAITMSDVAEFVDMKNFNDTNIRKILKEFKVIQN